MMNWRNLLIALVALALPAAIVHAAPAEDWTGRDPKAEQSLGAQVYQGTCAACHDAGVGRAPQRFILQDMTPEAIHTALTQGVMRPQATALSVEQKSAVAEYLTGRKLGTTSNATAPNMCKGAAARFDLAEPPAFTGWGLDAASTHAIPRPYPDLAPAMRRVSSSNGPSLSRARSAPGRSQPWRAGRFWSAITMARSMRLTARQAVCAGPFLRAPKCAPGSW